MFPHPRFQQAFSSSEGDTASISRKKKLLCDLIMLTLLDEVSRQVKENAEQDFLKYCSARYTPLMVPMDDSSTWKHTVDLGLGRDWGDHP